MEYNVKIIRSSRKSLLLSVSAENEIVLKCPRSVSESKIKSFLDSKRNWLERIILQNQLKLSQNNEVLNFQKIYVFGDKLPLIISDKNCILKDSVFVKSIKDIKTVFIKHFSAQFLKLLNELSFQTNLKFNGVEIRRYKRRWGCCDSKGKLHFNFLLFMLPLFLQRYVIIHELCHTVHFNHSPEFWELVKRFEPDYKDIRKQLKAFDFITNLY